MVVRGVAAALRAVKFGNETLILKKGRNGCIDNLSTTRLLSKLGMRRGGSRLRSYARPF